MDRLVPYNNPRYWSGLESFAIRTDNDDLMREVVTNRDAAIRRDDSLITDAMIPRSRTIAHSSAATVAEGYEMPGDDIDYKAFGADRSADPRALELAVIESGFVGEVAPWCCGMSATTLSSFMREKLYRRAYYSISFSFCPTTQILAQYAGLFNYMATYSAAAEDLLAAARAELAFFGCKTQNLRGLADLPVGRLRLDQPLDTLSADEIYSYLTSAVYDDYVRRGDESMELTHMLAPTGYKLLRAQRIPGTLTGETLGESLDKGFSLKTKYTRYMNSVSTNGSPALFMYARNSGKIKRDIAFEPFLLPPRDEGGKLVLQYVMSIGELRTSHSSAGLMIENALSSGAN